MQLRIIGLVIGQLTSSCIISDLVCKEQPIKIQYFNIGNNNDYYMKRFEWKIPNNAFMVHATYMKKILLEKCFKSQHADER